jgi:ribosomal protein S21
MGVQVALRAGEDLEGAYRRFEALWRHDQRRPWTKRRFGYYESPGALRRKRRRAGRVRDPGRPWDPPNTLSSNLPVEPAALWRRTGPNEIGR